MADKTYIVKITTQAKEKLQAIVKYITSELKAPKAALRLLDEIESSVSSAGCIDRRSINQTVVDYKHSSKDITHFFVHYVYSYIKFRYASLSVIRPRFLEMLLLNILL